MANKPKKPKEVELNVPDKSLNMADISDKNTSDSATKKSDKGNRSSRRQNNRASKSNKGREAEGNAIHAKAASNLLSNLTVSSTRLIETWPAGKRINFNFPSSVQMEVASIPGVMEIDFVPTIGYSPDINSPASIAFQKLHAFLQSTVSVSIDPEPADLGLYMFAWDTVFMWYNSLCRVHATMNGYDLLNRYYPRALVAAQGFNFSDLFSKQAQLEYYINALGYKISQFYVPAGYEFMSRHMWMTSGIYLDADEPKAQAYVFRPHIMYTFVETDTNKPAYLDPIVLQPYYDKGGFTMEDIISITETLINPILQSGTMRDISALLLRAFGASNMMKIDGVLPGDIINPEYKPEVLEQLGNSTIFPIPDLSSDSTFGDSFQITQGELDSGVKAGAIIQTCQWVIKDKTANPDYLLQLYVANRMLNVMNGNYTADNVLEATRWMVIPALATKDVDPKVGTYLSFNGYGTEILCGLTIYYINFNNDVSYMLGFDTYFDISKPSIYEVFRRLSLQSAFDWSPVAYGCTGPTTEGGTSYVHGPICEARDFTVVGNLELTKIHETKVLSAFDNNLVNGLSINPFSK